MAEFYGKKIASGETNPKTDEPWKIEDVPTLWRAATQKWLDEHVDTED